MLYPLVYPVKIRVDPIYGRFTVRLTSFEGFSSVFFRDRLRRHVSFFTGKPRVVSVSVSFVIKRFILIKEKTAGHFCIGGIRMPVKGKTTVSRVRIDAR